MIANSATLAHPFDITIDSDRMDLLAEELPEQVQLLSDCLSTGSSFSCCGTAGTFACFGTVVSSGKSA